MVGKWSLPGYLSNSISWHAFRLLSLLYLNHHLHGVINDDLLFDGHLIREQSTIS